MKPPPTGVARRRGGRDLYKTRPAELQNTGTKSNPGQKPKKLREYLEVAEVQALVDHAPQPTARLCMMLQWRAGLRISEAIRVTPPDVHLDANPPEIKIRQGKGRKDRIGPAHFDLAYALKNAIGMWKLKKGDPMIGVTRQVAGRWYKEALAKCYELELIPEGKPCATHTPPLGGTVLASERRSH